jgi:hypothetical protein
VPFPRRLRTTEPDDVEPLAQLDRQIALHVGVTPEGVAPDIQLRPQLHLVHRLPPVSAR